MSKHSYFMHELSLHDNKKVQFFTAFNTNADTQYKMTAVFLSHVKFT